jgi:hypothetical protein
VHGVYTPSGLAKKTMPKKIDAVTPDGSGEWKNRPQSNGKDILVAWLWHPGCFEEVHTGSKKQIMNIVAWT